MGLKHQCPALTNERLQISKSYRQDEKSIVSILLEEATLDKDTLKNISKKASELVIHVREERMKSSGIDAFLHQYSLTSDEGVALMCLAEALLRVPDKATIDELIRDKLTGTDWSANMGKNNSLFVNATTWALMLTGRVLTPAESGEAIWNSTLKKIVGRAGEGVIRKAVAQAMKIMSRQFVMGRDITEALERARILEEKGYCYSYDMLGEAALTEEDSDSYFNAYKNAVIKIGVCAKEKDVYQSPGVSVKLSALFPRYEVAQYHDAIEALSKRLLELCLLAKQHQVALTVDAEEADRLDMSLDIIENVFGNEALADWQGFGLAVQSYQKRAFYVLDWVAALARRHGRRIMVRLIKGAYWDTEIKLAQIEGLKGYPVFTYKSFTDVSFQACAKKLFTMTDAIYPQFATHNAYSVALVLTLAGDCRDFEFQCLHGMGQELYDAVTPKDRHGIPCRIYAPVGSHEDLLPYLVRRLLENGANSSFVNRIADSKLPVEKLVGSPMVTAKQQLTLLEQNIPLPKDIFANARKNSSGIDLSDYKMLEDLSQKMGSFDNTVWSASSLIADMNEVTPTEAHYSPADTSKQIGHVVFCDLAGVDKALEASASAFLDWSGQPVEVRAEILEKMATLLEENKYQAYALLQQEAGKTIHDAINEVREAVDFCRYYAKEAKANFSCPVVFQGYTGELNQLSYHGRGPMLCISPWNFPLAIFLGQIAASLAAGNTVIAKPAEQTCLIAYWATKLFHQAGAPKAALQLVLGEGATVGASLVKNKRIKGVLFTGSTDTAQAINQSLASRGGEIVPLIAETGGQNSMIVDSSALLEQVVVDVLVSSFGSCGQRCSALRVIYVQQDVYPRFKQLLKGAMEKLKVGSPEYFGNDVGPVIDKHAQASLEKHVNAIKQQGELIYEVDISSLKTQGFYFSPVAVEIDSISMLDKENFGPILHVCPYEKSDLETVIADINATGYGLTLGIHSRIDEVISYIASKVNAGNCYINRNMTGAVVGLQPFGGEGLSGTGPKAGGPNYLRRLSHERTLSIDTTAAGGNASLMSQV